VCAFGSTFTCMTASPRTVDVSGGKFLGPGGYCLCRCKPSGLFPQVWCWGLFVVTFSCGKCGDHRLGGEIMACSDVGTEKKQLPPVCELVTNLQGRMRFDHPPPGAATSCGWRVRTPQLSSFHASSPTTWRIICRGMYFMRGWDVQYRPKTSDWAKSVFVFVCPPLIPE